MQDKNWATIAVLAFVAIATVAMAPIVAADGVAAQANETETCEAGIDNFDVHTADDTIEGADDPGLVGVSASTSVTNECNIVLQVTFDIPNNMHYQGTSASASGQGLQTEVFEVQPGDVSSFTTELYANQEGEHTVVADVEYFPEGEPEDARTLDNFMLSFNAVDTGLPSDVEPDEPGPDEPSSDQPEPILVFLENNLGVVALFALALVLAVGLIKREPILNVFTGGE